jgi:hypothetical protein
MSRKWVDNEVYFGPDRRTRGLGKRWGDRRTHDDAAEPPPLSAVLRRLRVHLGNVTTAEDRDRAGELAQFALTEADRQHLSPCATHLREVMVQIAQGDLASADTAVMQAQAALNAS